jgi:hypothetical protein
MGLLVARHAVLLALGLDPCDRADGEHETAGLLLQEDQIGPDARPVIAAGASWVTWIGGTGQFGSNWRMIQAYQADIHEPVDGRCGHA